MLTARQLDEVVAKLDERLELDALWLFGSEARGTATARSDVDLAGLFRGRPSTVALLDARAELAEQLGRDVDLVDLDRASPVLAMQVARGGRIVLDRDPDRRVRFLGELVSRFEDVERFRRPIERAIMARFRDRA